jgi:hypothetical protein
VSRIGRVSDELASPRGVCRRRVRRNQILAALAFSLAGASPLADAQETREQTIAAEQAKKAQTTTPPAESKAEQVLDYINANYLKPKPRGFYAFLDSVYPGGNFTLGAGYRQAFADHSSWTVRGLYSIKNYKQVELLVGAHDRASITNYGARAGWRDATQVSFFGVGQDAPKDARTAFGFEQGYAGVWAVLRPSHIIRLDADVAYEDFSTKEGAGGFPSIEEHFTADTAPGLFASPAYLHVNAAAGIDWRPAEGYARTGGYYGVRLNAYHDVDDTYSFKRLDGDIIQHIPLVRETFVLSLRGRVQTTLDDDDVVPYFLLPSLGSSRTLRAYDTFRFRDRHSLLTSAEWRWIPSRLGIDMAIFYDAGKVASRREDLGFKGLAHDVGVGIRFHGPAVTVLRVEVARGSEGWNMVFAASPPF